MRAIQTMYKGYRFRSRLEARWAVFFEHLGIKFEYEPEGYELGIGERYLPDFWLPEFHCEKGLYVEVKPTTGFDFSKARLFAKQSGNAVLCVNGPPEPQGYLLFEHFDSEMLETDGAFVSKYLSGGINGSEYRLYVSVGHDGPIDWAYIDHAVNAARGARFEFGESGA